jgi:hypothetical protein
LAIVNVATDLFLPGNTFESKKTLLLLGFRFCSMGYVAYFLPEPRVFFETNMLYCPWKVLEVQSCTSCWAHGCVGMNGSTWLEIFEVTKNPSTLMAMSDRLKSNIGESFVKTILNCVEGKAIGGSN